VPRRRAPEFKQMAFETAVRNPERYKGLLKAIVQYENQNLDDAKLLEIVSTLYLIGEVSSSEIVITENSSVESISDSVKRVNSTRNGDGGFPKGYQARFWTYMRTLSEFGFVYARYREPLKISSIAKLLINEKIDEQEAFSIQSMKYNRKSPYRRVSNDFNYFKFILQVLTLLRDSGKRLTYEQFIVSLFDQTGDPNAFLSEIASHNLSDEVRTYNYLREKYDVRNAQQTIMRDYPDVVLRVLRITGFVNVIYSGKTFIEINSDKIDLISALLRVPFTLTNSEKENELEFFNKFESNSNEFIDVINKFRDSETIDGFVYANKLKNVIDTYEITEQKVVSYINNIHTRTTRPEFKYIPEPLQLEFFISILLYLKYGDSFGIRPNYKADALGMPITHAPGNGGDIEVYNSEKYWLVEVTLIRNRNQQLNSETTTTLRHLFSSDEFANYQEKYLSLVAPVIHQDTEDYYRYAIFSARQKDVQAHIKPYSIAEFVAVTTEKRNLSDMQVYSKKVIENLISGFQ
jgi:hypothetical protein